MNELWQPASACGAACLDDDEPRPELGAGRRAARLGALVGVMGLAAVLVLVLALLPAARRARLIRSCARGVLRALDIRVTRQGNLPGRPAGDRSAGRRFGGVLVVANHVSWLDIVVLLADGRVRLVAKSEVRGWPVIGLIARYAGTIFVDRSRPRALPAAVAEVRSALAAGDTVAVFPEGTTSCGRSTGRFRPAFFQAAVDAHAAVVPVTLRFRLAGTGPTCAASFVGEETLLVSLRRVLGLPGLRIGLSCGAAIHPTPGATRWVLARVAGTAVGGCAPAPVAGARRPARAPDPAPTVVLPVRTAPTPAEPRTAPVLLRPAA